MKNKVIILIVMVSVFLTKSMAQESGNRYFEINKNIEIFNAVVKELDMFYVDTLDVEKSIRYGIESMLGNLDPYTNYITETDMDEFKFMTTGEYAGIGSYISTRKIDGKYFVLISGPHENMPAAKAGLKSGDIILSVDNTDVSELSKTITDKNVNTLNTSVSEKLKGKPGTTVKLKIQRPGEKKPREISIVRELIHVNSVTYYGKLNNDVGYISLSGFTDKCSQEVKAAFLDLKKQGITSLILDLRGNGGGILEEAIQIVNFFVPKGKVVLSTKGKLKQGERTYRTTQEPIDTEIPLTVLVDRGSASASEITSGALQDMDRAVIMGERTFGKGLVQLTRELPYGGSLKITTSKYYIPSGRCIQAIDYTHRNEDGSVGRIPDSLTTVFKTANGREVRDGGGIVPDFELKEEKSPSIVYYLINQFIIFDFVTDWALSHPKIAPVESFSISDKDYEEFKTFVKSKPDFKYDVVSAKTMNSLKEVMEYEGYMTIAAEEFKALEEKLVANLDRDLETFKEDITEFINSEIAKRYYFQRGESIQSLKTDKLSKKAIEILHDSEQYKALLKPKQD